MKDGVYSWGLESVPSFLALALALTLAFHMGGIFRTVEESSIHLYNEYIVFSPTSVINTLLSIESPSRVVELLCVFFLSLC